MNIFFATALLLQGQTAEETFKKIEESIDKAKTVSVKFKFVSDTRKGGVEEKAEASGTMLLKDARKVNVAMKTLQNGQEMDVSIVSDGPLRSKAYETRFARIALWLPTFANGSETAEAPRPRW
jgi:hypothetical protein